MINRVEIFAGNVLINNTQVNPTSIDISSTKIDDDRVLTISLTLA